MKPGFSKSPGTLLLGVWVVLVSLLPLVPLIASLGILVNVVGVAAGVLLLMGR